MISDERNLPWLTICAYAAITLIIFSTGLLVWFLFLDPISPMRGSNLVRVEAASPPGATSYLLVTRETCFSREDDLQTTRLFLRKPDTEDQYEEAIDAPPVTIRVDPGCATRTRRIDLPVGMRSGSWTFRSGLRGCNAIGRCRTVWMKPVVLSIDGKTELHAVPFEEIH